MIYIQMCSTYAPSWAFGGVVRILYGYAGHMAGRVDTWVLAGNLDERQRVVSSGFDDAQNYSVQRYGFLSRRLARRNIHTPSVRMLWDLVRLAKRHKGLVVLHLGELRGAVNLYALLARFVVGRRLRIIHSAFGGLHEKPSRLRAAYDRLLMGPFLKSLDLAIAQNEHEAGEYRQLMSAFGARASQDRISILPLHFDHPTSDRTGWFENGAKAPAARRAVRRALELPQEALIFCFLGRFHPKKGILRAIDLFCGWKAESGDDTAQFLIIGRDEGFEQEIRRHAANSAFPDSIRIITGIYAERFDYFYASDVFIGVPTMFEETMLASLEALSCGTPLLLSREADAPYIEEERAGRVIDFDLETAKAALKEIVGDYERFSRQALATSVHFERGPVLTALDALLSQLTEETVQHHARTPALGSDL
ncbi:MAG: glycosyltransferase [Brevundimonas sp.]|uniref:glycosyltransferase n=1 Tax=Brevundimonas sp. TaxID=1871086 RepID=UPI00391B6BD0